MKLLIASLVIVGITIIYVSYPIGRAISQHRSMPAVSPYEQNPENPTMNILVAGDSTGVGTGVTDNRDSIAGRIGRDYPHAQITNISENGLTLAALAKKLTAHTEANYDMVVLQIGANDVVGVRGLGMIAPELRTVLDQAEAKGKRVVLITAGNIGLAPIFRWPLSAYLTKRTLAVRQLFMKEAATRNTVTYVDLFESAETDIFSTDITRYYALDRFHPSGAGYGVWYEKVQQVIE